MKTKMHIYKKYEDLLERVKKMINAQPSNIKNILLTWVPELKEESEDERIRKEIIKTVELYGPKTGNPKQYNDMIAWLEKQGEQKREVEGDSNARKPTLVIRKDKKYICIKDYQDKNCTFTKGKIYESDKDGFLVDDEEKDTFERKIWEEDACEYFCLFEQGKPKPIVTDEKQKPADKIEPKFKIEEGKWYVCISQFCNCIEGRVYKATSDSRIMDDFGTEYDMHSDADKYFRPWIIQDAKDGDVLVASDGSIFLFKCMIDCACKHYVALATDGVIKFNEGLEHYWETSRATQPATKEQRNALEKAMTDAGYTFNFEKKELRKIEQKPVEFCNENKEFSESVSEKIRNMVSRLFTGDFNIISKKFADQFAWELLTLARYEIQKEQSPTEWSEEDEEMLKKTIEAVEGYYAPYLKDTESHINWLKSFRSQNTWKPSEEQITWLYRATNEAKKDSRMKQVLNELLSDLKKLTQ